jgi:hypothetical protein
VIKEDIQFTESYLQNVVEAFAFECQKFIADVDLLSGHLSASQESFEDLYNGLNGLFNQRVFDNTSQRLEDLQLALESIWFVQSEVCPCFVAALWDVWNVIFYSARGA